MLSKFVGKMLFRSFPAWQQRRLANTALIVLLTTITFASVLAAAMYWLNSKR